MKDQNWHPKIVESYLTKHYKNERSRKTVRVYLKVFFTTINKDPEKWLKQPIKAIKDDLWLLAQKIENKPNKTQSTILVIIKKYLERHDIQLKTSEWEELRLRNNLVKAVRSIVKKATPTQSDLKKILSFASSIKTKTFFTLLASSGLRRDELLQLTWADIDLNNRMISLPEDIAKGKIPRFTFFSEEAKELLELWKPERNKLLLELHRKSTILRTNLQKKGYELKKVRGSWTVYKNGKELPKEEVIKLDNRIFPYEAENFEKIWIRLLEKAGKPYNNRDDNTRLQYPRYAYNIHSLRRFWFTQLRSDRMNDEFYNYIGGHTSLLDRTYGDWLHDTTMQQMIKKEYDSHMNAISIYQVEPNLSGINESLKEKDEQIRKLTENQRLLEMTLQGIQNTLDNTKNSLEIEKIKNGKKH